MKCSACQEKKCERKFKNRNECVGKKEEIKCTCICRVSKIRNAITTASAITIGVVAVGGGIALTVGSSGMVSALMISGVGSSLIMNSIRKQIAGDQVSVRDTLKSVTFGAASGAFNLVGIDGNQITSAGEAAVEITTEMMHDAFNKSSTVMHNAMKVSSVYAHDVAEKISFIFSKKKIDELIDDSVMHETGSFREKTSRKFNKKLKNFAAENDTLQAITDGINDPNQLYRKISKKFIAEFLYNDEDALYDLRILFKDDQKDEISKLYILPPEKKINKYEVTLDVLEDIESFFDDKNDDEVKKQEKQLLWKKFSKKLLRKDVKNSMINQAILQAIELGTINPKQFFADTSKQFLAVTTGEMSKDLENEILNDIRLLFKDDLKDKISEVHILPPKKKEKNSEMFAEMLSELQNIFKKRKTVKESSKQKKGSFLKRMSKRIKKGEKRSVNTLSDTIDAKNQYSSSNKKEDEKVLYDLRILYKDDHKDEISKIYILPPKKHLKERIGIKNNKTTDENSTQKKKSLWKKFTHKFESEEIKPLAMHQAIIEAIKSGKLDPKHLNINTIQQLTAVECSAEDFEEEIFYDIRLLFKDEQNDEISATYILPPEINFKKIIDDFLNDYQKFHENEDFDEYLSKNGINVDSLLRNEFVTKSSKKFQSKKVEDKHQKEISFIEKISMKFKSKEKIKAKTNENENREIEHDDEVLDDIRILFKRDHNEEISQIYILPLEKAKNSQEAIDEILCDIQILFKDDQHAAKGKTKLKLFKSKKVSINKVEKNSSRDKERSFWKKNSDDMKKQEKISVLKEVAAESNEIHAIEITEMCRDINNQLILTSIDETLQEAVTPVIDLEEILCDVHMLFIDDQHEIKEERSVWKKVTRKFSQRVKHTTNKEIKVKTTLKTIEVENSMQSSVDITTEFNEEISDKTINDMSKDFVDESLCDFIVPFKEDQSDDKVDKEEKATKAGKMLKLFKSKKDSCVDSEISVKHTKEKEHSSWIKTSKKNSKNEKQAANEENKDTLIKEMETNTTENTSDLSHKTIEEEKDISDNKENAKIFENISSEDSKDIDGDLHIKDDQTDKDEKINETVTAEENTKTEKKTKLMKSKKASKVVSESSTDTSTNVNENDKTDDPKNICIDTSDQSFEASIEEVSQGSDDYNNRENDKNNANEEIIDNKKSC